MNFDLGNIITLCIVAAALALYRALDRNNRSLEKVKKYADRLKEELAAFVGLRQADLKDFAIELDVRQKAAKEVLIRVREIEEALNSRAQALDSIGKRIAEYDKVLDELMGMTERADENLVRIKEESAFADTVAKKLKEAESRLESIAKGIPALAQEFKRLNDESLAGVAAGLKAGVERSMSSAEAAAQEAARRAEAAAVQTGRMDAERAARAQDELAALQDAFEAAFQKARREAERLEDSAFTKLKDSISGRAQKLQETLEEKYQGLQASAKEKIQDTQAMLKGYKAEYQAEIKALSDERELRAAESEARLASIDERLAAAEGELSGTLAELGDEMDRREAAMRKKLADGVLSAETEAEARAAAIAKRLAAAEAGFDDSVAKLGQELAQREASMRKAFAEGIKASEAEAAKALEEARSRMEKGLADLATATSARVVQAEAGFKASLEELSKRGAGLSEAAKAELDEAFARKKAGALKEFEALSADMERSVSDLRSEMDYKYQKLGEAEADVERLDAAIRSSMAAVEDGIERDFRAFGDSISARQRAEEERLSGEMASLQASLAELERGVAELKDNAYQSVSEKLKVFEDGFFRDLAKRSDAAQERIGAWESSLDARLADAGSKAEAARAGLERAYQEELKERISKLQARAAEQVEKVEERLGAFEGSSSERMEAVRAELSSFQASVRAEAEESGAAARGAFEAEVARFLQESGERIKKAEKDLFSWKDSIQKSMKEFHQLGEAQRAALGSQMDALGLEAAGLRKDLADRSAQAIQALGRSYDELLADAQRRAREIAGETDAKVREMKALAAEIKDKVETTQARLLSRIEEEAGTLRATLDELERREKDFAAQTKIFERSDELKLKLEEDIEALRSAIARAESQRGELSGLESQLDRVRRLEDEINQKMNRFLAERKRIDSMEEDFKRLIGISQGIDAKLESVTSSHDVLTEIEARMRKLTEAGSQAEAKYERLEKKGTVLDAAIEGVDRNFQAIRDIEKSVKAQDDELKVLPARIAELRRSVDALTADKERVQAAADRLSDLDGTLSGIEDRIASMQKAREWLAGTETRLQELAKEAQDQVKVLGDIMKRESGSSRKEQGAPPSSVRETVTKLARQGWKVEEISRATKLSRGEVELILELGPGK